MADHDLEKITEKIVCDAREAAAAVLEAAEQEQDKILTEGRRNAEERAARIAAEGEEETAFAVKRIYANFEMYRRNAYLKVKQEQITACYDQAGRALCTMLPEAYLSLLKDVISRNIESGQILELILNRADRSRFGDALTAAFGENTVLSEETADISGGVLLRCGNVCKNYSFEALLEQARSCTDQEVADLLFKQ